MQNPTQKKYKANRILTQATNEECEESDYGDEDQDGVTEIGQTQ